MSGNDCKLRRRLLRTLLSICLFFSTAQLAVVAVSAHAQTDTWRLRVGAILPLSGETASMGNAFRNGMEHGLRSLSKDDREALAVFYEDDGLNSAKTVSAFSKLQAQRDIHVVVNLSSGTSHAVAPLAERAAIPLIAIASDPKLVQGRTHVFNFWVTPEEEARMAVAEALKRGYKHIARISTIHEGVSSINRAFDHENNGKVEIALDEEVPPDMKDFRAFIAKLRGKKAIDAILPMIFPGQLSAFTRQIRQSGIATPFFGFEFFEDSNEVKAAAGTLVGAWYVNADDPSGNFLDSFRRQFPTSSLYSAGSGHDTVLLLAAAARKIQESRSASHPGDAASEREIVREFLATLKDFSGVLGTFSSTGDGRFSLKAAIKEVTSEGFKTLHR